MQKLVREYLNELKKKQKRRRRAGIAAMLLTVLVVGAVIGTLTQYGVAMTGDVKCGLEEHQHGAECYTDTLACGLEENTGHIHSETCSYPAELICGQEETVAQESLGMPESAEAAEGTEVPYGADVSGNVQGHIHSDACYAVPEGWACGQEENAGHTHSDACCISELSCEKEEHTHTELCYIDTNADVEEASKWNEQYEDIEWSGSWSEDLVTAAKIQIGYKESSDNYTIAEDESHKGYTRYGQFVDDVYRDWDVAFVNFCMYYAGLIESNIFPNETVGAPAPILYPEGLTDSAKWREEFVEMNKENENYLTCLTAAEGYIPKAGDLVFLQREEEDQDEETDNRMGIVSGYDEEKNEIKVIEGNRGNEVKESDYGIEDSHITAYMDIDGLEELYWEEQSEEPGETEEPVEEPDEIVEEGTEEPTIELTTEVDGTTITLSGPASSFEEGREYAIQAEKVENEETIATIEEAIGQVAEEKTGTVDKYQAFDIKLIADGEEVQPLGPVEVRFSGNEVAESVEDEESEVNVLHVDETTGTVQDMEAKATEEKELAIETTHFSIYVWVNLKDITGSITVKVEHYGNVKTVKGTADASKGTDTVLKKNGSTATVQTKTENKQLYSTDTLKVPNQYYETVEELSKVLNVNNKGKNNYSVTSVKIGDKTYYKKPGTEKYYTTTAYKTEVKEIELSSNTTIRFNYEPVSSSETMAATFYDHNITDGKRYNSSGTETTSGKYLKTNGKKINANARFANQDSTKKRLGSGQPAAGNMSPWADTAKFNGSGNYLNKGNGGDGADITKGIVTGCDSNGLKFSTKVDPSSYLFRKSSTSTITRSFSGTLGFNKEGDTYTLSNAKVGSYTNSGLTTIKGYADNAVYSNNFWPLDKVSYEGKDPNMGGSTTFHCLDGAKGDISTSDDGKAHNWFFGMKYEFTFEIGDYVGPMEYYFRGDDDFWLFVDGKLLVDLGGIHVAAGETCDIRSAMKKANVWNTGKHTMTIYYMERGGFGSCCYMQFTLPNSNPVTPSVDTTSYSVQKKWDDSNNPYRPDSITVELTQNDKTTGKKVTLNAANNWKYTWNGLPKQEKKNNITYNYKVKEVTPNGYTSQLVGGVLTNKLVPVKVHIKKEWNDYDLTSYRPDAVKFQLYANETAYTGDTGGGTQGILTLSENNNWEGTFENLPQYDKNGKAITYTVREIGGLGENAVIQGKDGAIYSVGDYNYIIKKAANEVNTTIDNPAIATDVTVTNELKFSKLKITKRIDKYDESDDKATAEFRYKVVLDKKIPDHLITLEDTGTDDKNTQLVYSSDDSKTEFTFDINFDAADKDKVGFADKAGKSVMINLPPGNYKVYEYSARGYELVKEDVVWGEVPDNASAINGQMTPLTVPVTSQVMGTGHFWNRFKDEGYTIRNEVRFADDGSVSISKKTDVDN